MLCQYFTDSCNNSCSRIRKTPLWWWR